MIEGLLIAAAVLLGMSIALDIYLYRRMRQAEKDANVMAMSLSATRLERDDKVSRQAGVIEDYKRERLELLELIHACTDPAVLVDDLERRLSGEGRRSARLGTAVLDGAATAGAKGASDAGS